MLKRTRSMLVLSLALATIAPLLLSTPSLAQAPYKRVYLEEFTGAWCGFCPRGAYAINNLYASYPGQVTVVSIHSDQGSPVNDQMDIPQGDSVISDIGFPPAEALQGFPDGWTARTVQGATWNVDPSAWATGVAAQFGIGGADGIVAGLLAQPVDATVTVDNISFDNTTQQVTARVSVTFAAAESGDLRLNLMVTEDSVTGSGSGWDQHNYYSSTGSVGPSVPGNPMYSYPPSIPGWQHMHVFREAVGGVHGQAGIIPSSVSKGGTYSTTFTFTLPSNIQDPNHVHLIGLVNNYSATDASGNAVLDADEVPLIGPAPKYFITNLSLAPQAQYGTATSGSSTPEIIAITNNGAESVTLNLSVDASKLPTGWSATMASDTVTVAAGATVNQTVNVTAPEQSAFTSFNVSATPIKEGYVVATTNTTQYMLSGNTQYGFFVANGASYETALYAGIPDTMKLHMAVIPFTSDVSSNYDFSQYPIIILNNLPILDFTADLGLGVASSMQMLQNALSAGDKIFINSDDALGYAFDASDGYYSQFSQYTETSDVQTFYQQLGIDFTKTVRNWNTNTGTLTPFSIKGEASDPISNGINATDKGGFLSEVYTIDSNSSPVFYSSGSTKNVIGSRYVDTSTGARLVYLGFGLSELTETTTAKTIATNSINWLLSSSSAAVNAPAAAPVAGMTASPNPFHGMTQVQYVAGQDEHGVSLAAYDLLGREVAKLATQSNGGGVYTALFDGSKLADGTYVIVAHSTAGTHEVRVVNQQ